MALALVGLNLAAISTSVWIDASVWITGGWPRPMIYYRGDKFFHYSFEMRDGSEFVLLTNGKTGAWSGPFLKRVPKLSLLGEIWWPVAASVGVTSLTLGIAFAQRDGRVRQFLRRPRLTVKGWMATVALLAFVTWAVLLFPRAVASWDKSLQSAWDERGQAAQLGQDRLDLIARRREAAEAARGGLSEGELLRHKLYVRAAEADVEDRLEIISYYRRLKEKYRRAAMFPWEPASPDPPHPRRIVITLDPLDLMEIVTPAPDR